MVLIHSGQRHHVTKRYFRRCSPFTLGHAEPFGSSRYESDLCIVKPPLDPLLLLCKAVFFQRDAGQHSDDRYPGVTSLSVSKHHCRELTHQHRTPTPHQSSTCGGCITERLTCTTSAHHRSHCCAPLLTGGTTTGLQAADPHQQILSAKVDPHHRFVATHHYGLHIIYPYADARCLEDSRTQIITFKFHFQFLTFPHNFGDIS